MIFLNDLLVILMIAMYDISVRPYDYGRHKNDYLIYDSLYLVSIEREEKRDRNIINSDFASVNLASENPRTASD